MSSPLLQAVKCSKHFGGLAAVKNLDIEIEEQEILALIGPNGAGKTTFLNMLAGTLQPSSGDIVFKGQSISHLKPYKRVHLGIARTFQIPRPFPEMTVKENVMVGFLFGRESREKVTGYKDARSEEKVLEILNEVGLYKVKDKLSSQLPLAQVKRLELARALVTDPKVLLLDEVMAGLNRKEVEEIMQVILQLNASGKTVILVEHIMKVVMNISHRVIVMHHGEKLAEGKPSEVAFDPRVVQAYMGTKYAAQWGAMNARSG